MRQKEVPRWGGCSYKEKIRRGALYRGINSLAFMILGAETIFPPSFYSFPYLLVYPFSQEFDAISPQLPWTVCTFDKGIIKFGVHVYRVLLFANISILSLKKNKHTQCVYIYFDSCTRGRHVWKIQNASCFFFFLHREKLCVFLRDIIFIFNPWEHLLEFRIFPSFFFFKKSDTRNNILVSWTRVDVSMMLFRHFSSPRLFCRRVVANNCRNTTFNPNVNPLVYFSLSNEGKEGAQKLP